MSCTRVRRELSEYMDDELSGPRLHAVSAHLDSCAPCARHLEELRGACESLASLPRLASPEPLGAGVLDRVEVESRGPGLALLFRSARAARPLMFPSVLPAALVLLCSSSVVLLMGARDVRSYNEAHASGSDTDPLSPGEGASSPQTASDIFVDYQLSLMPSQSLFVETVVAPDGRVLNVTLLEGDSYRAAPILKEMRYQRYMPGLSEQGEPVKMRAYRLFDSVEVRAPLT
jgi:hypothetical protein